MKSFFDFLEDDSTELDERVDSIQTRLKRAKGTKKESCQDENWCEKSQKKNQDR